MNMCDKCIHDEVCGIEGNHEEAITYCADMIPKPKTGHWIPVSERLPEKDEYVDDVCKYYLIQDEYGDMHVAHYSSIGWIPINSIKAIGDDVVAWMSLPENYTAESEEEHDV